MDIVWYSRYINAHTRGNSEKWWICMCAFEDWFLQIIYLILHLEFDAFITCVFQATMPWVTLESYWLSCRLLCHKLVS